MNRIIVFDLEIMHPVDEKKGGWPAAIRGECGVSCVILYDSVTGRYHIYGPDRLEDCVDHLNTADLLVSFNGIGFDGPILENLTGIGISPPHFDILKAIWDTIGKRAKGWKLGDTCNRTLGIQKSDTGEHAPTLWAQNRIDELHDYCLNDVHITKELFNWIQDNNALIDQLGDELHVPPPEMFEGEII